MSLEFYAQSTVSGLQLYHRERERDDEDDNDDDGDDDDEMVMRQS